jgi:hypothetical protein
MRFLCGDGSLADHGSGASVVHSRDDDNSCKCTILPGLAGMFSDLCDVCLGRKGPPAAAGHQGLASVVPM